MSNKIFMIFREGCLSLKSLLELDKQFQGKGAFSGHCESFREVSLTPLLAPYYLSAFSGSRLGLDKPWEAPSPESETAAEVVTTG